MMQQYSEVGYKSPKLSGFTTFGAQKSATPSGSTLIRKPPVLPMNIGGNMQGDPYSRSVAIAGKGLTTYQPPASSTSSVVKGASSTPSVARSTGSSGGSGVPSSAPLEGYLNQARDAQLASATAGYAKTRDQQLLDIAKAYDDAVAQGKISITDATKQYNDAVKQINAQAYKDSQVTQLVGYDRGIQNSQQLLGLMAGDNARKNDLNANAMSERDVRINQINDRIASLLKQKGMDTAQANKDYNYNVTQAKNDIYAKYYDSMFGLKQDAFNRYLSGVGSSSGKSSAKASDALNSLADQYAQFKQTEGTTPLDNYYQNQMNIMRGTAPHITPALAPVSVAQNASLSDWQKMRLMMGQSY